MERTAARLLSHLQTRSDRPDPEGTARVQNFYEAAWDQEDAAEREVIQQAITEGRAPRSRRSTSRTKLETTHPGSTHAASETKNTQCGKSFAIERNVLDMMKSAQHRRSIQIINGLKPGTLTRALDGEHVGTIITA